MRFMEPGNIVEYIEKQNIICAVIMETKDTRLRILTENDREANIAAKRLSNRSSASLDLSMGRDSIVKALKETAEKRLSIMEQVDVKKLWETLNTEKEWISLKTMTELCFPGSKDPDNEAAVSRAFFKNRTYFKFSNDRFLPYSEKQVEDLIKKTELENQRKQLIEKGAAWLKKAGQAKKSSSSEMKQEIVDILTSFYLYGKESRHYTTARAILSKAKIDPANTLFNLLVRHKIWDKDENLDIYRYDIPVSFPEQAMAQAEKIADMRAAFTDLPGYRDMTMLPAMTIDGETTLDFDDALSLEEDNDHYNLGIHITDMGYYIKKGDPLDIEAMKRATSIYMPDMTIPMIPRDLSEHTCSLKANEVRPTISILVKISRFGRIKAYEVVPALINVKQRLTYSEANKKSEDDREINILHGLAVKLREQRVASGAMNIILPEINILVDKEGKTSLIRSDRESPGRMLVEEMMILANRMTAEFLAGHNTPAFFRSQADPRERLIKKSGSTLFEYWMQRKHLSRGLISHKPEHHSGLGFAAYITSTSPLRKYHDLITQRQVRAMLGMEEPYTAEEIDRFILATEMPLQNAGKVQFQRNRYWLLKHLEGKKGEKEEAIVLEKRRNSCLVLLEKYMLECRLPLTSGISLKPKDLIQVTIQHADARNDVLSIYPG